MKNKLWKSLLSCILCMAMLAGLAACGTTNDAPAEATNPPATEAEAKQTEAPAVSQEPRTLKVMWWGNQARADSTAAMIELFEETHPGVTVEFEFTDWGGYWDKLSTQAISGSMPDVIQIDLTYLAQYANSGLLADISSYIDSGALDVSGVSQSVIDAGTLNGCVYAMPTGVNAMAVAYRPDVAAEAGVEIPMEMTWSEFLSISQTIYEKTGWKNLLASEVSSTAVEYMLRNHGMSFFSEDGNSLGFEDPSYLLETWQRALDAVEAGYALGIDEHTFNNMSECFIKDTWAYTVWTNQFPAYETDSGCELKLVNIISDDNSTEPANYVKPTVYWAATADSDAEDLAVEFINFFVNETAVYDIVGIDRGVPIDADVKTYMSGKLEGSNAKVNEFIAYLSEDGRCGSLVMDLNSSAAEVRDNLQQLGESILYGVTTDLEQAAKDYMAESNDILASAAK